MEEYEERDMRRRCERDWYERIIRETGEEDMRMGD